MLKEIDTISSFDEKKKNINGINTDYIAELVAACFIERGYDAERTLIIRNGANRRGFTKDIDSATVEFSQNDLSDYFYLKTNRDGIYDSLPETIFHNSTQSDRKPTKEAILKEMDQHRREEKQARRFFKPIETAIDHALVFVQAHERVIDKKNTNRNYVNIFTKYWPIIELLPLQQAVYFMKIVPMLQDISKNFGKISKVISIILGFPVYIETGKLSTITYDDEKENAGLGKYKLGLNMIYGKTFRDGYRNIQLTVGPINREELEYFIKDALGDKILKALINMLLPCDREIDILIKVIEEQAGFVLSDDKGKGSRLGINTILK